MKKIKILYVITGLSPGGAELSLKKMVSNLNPERYKIFICGLTKSNILVKELQKITPHVYTLNTNNIFTLLSGFLTLRKLIKTIEPDIIQCFMIHANLFGRLAAIGSDSYVIASVRNKLIEKKYLPFLIIDRFTQFLVDIYIALSKAVKTFSVQQGIKKEKILIIKNGIDLENLHPSKDPAQLKEELQLGSNPIIISIAHFRPQKDYPSLIKALALLKQKLDFTFLAVGITDEYPKVLQEVNLLIKRYNLPNIKILGFRKDIKALLAISDVWVSSTLYEGLSNSLLEAMAMKKPIITTDIPENSEVVREGIEALLVPTSNPKSMAEAIDKLLNDKNLSKKLAMNAYAKVKKDYDFNVIIRKYKHLYEMIKSKLK